MNIKTSTITIILSLALFSAILICILERIEYSQELSAIRSERRIIEDRLVQDIVVSEKEKKLKIVTMYSAIIGKYGYKFHPNNNSGNSRKYQGLNKYAKAEFIIKAFEYESLLEIPYFTLCTIALIETAFNPIAETFWEDGTLKEAGIFQNRREAVGQALLYFRELSANNPKIAQKLEFTFSDMKDLQNPINALKIEAILIWGLKRDFAGEMPYYISALHWGIHRVMPYYGSKTHFPEAFIFNKHTKREDIRNPLMYFTVFNEFYSSFCNYTTSVNVDMTWLARYKKRCSDVEWQFINSWKYLSDLKNRIKEIEEYKIASRQEHEEMILKLKSRMERTDEEYRKIMGIARSGKFTNIKDVFKLWRKSFLFFVAEVKQDKVVRYSLMIQSIVVGIIGIIIVFIMLLIIIFIKRFSTPYTNQTIAKSERNRKSQIPPPKGGKE